MAAPYQIERYRDPRPRLSQLGAVLRPGRSRIPGVELWESTTYKTWIQVQRTPTESVLSFFRSCPCAG